ncbi:lactonase family protein [Thiomicrolovo sp. ZZH C-3]
MSTGCGSSSSSVPKSKYVITANAEDDTLSSFTRDTATGALTPVAVMAAGSNPTGLVQHPNGKFVYSMNVDDWDNTSSASIDTWELNASGGLTHLANTRVVGMALNAVISPNGRYLYVTDQNEYELHSFKINTTTGALTEQPFSPTSEYEAHSIAMHPSGKFFYVGTEESEIHGHVITNDGNYTGTPNTPYAASGANNWLAITPNGDYLYTVDATGNEIKGFSVNEKTGEITLMAGFPVTTTGSGMKSCAVTPNGKYFYVTTKSDASVNAYNVESNGSLTYIDTYASGGHPKSVAVDSKSTSLYVANYDDNNVSAFEIGDTGALTPISKYAVGVGPKMLITAH